MKRFIFIFTLVISFAFSFKTDLSAAGTACCDKKYKYSSQDNLCHPKGGVPGNVPQTKSPTPCGSGESCLGSADGGPDEGICSEDTTSTSCCGSTDKFAYSSQDNLCHPKGGVPGNVPPKPFPPTCGSNQNCSTSGYCIVGTDLTSQTLPEFNMCQFAGDKSGDCETCLGDGGPTGGVWTAIGCIRFQPSLFIEDFMKIALGVAGGTALLLMIYGSFLLSVSTGDPKKAQEGKEIISGTIAGLLFIIFSVFLLKLIGVDILQIPGL